MLSWPLRGLSPVQDCGNSGLEGLPGTAVPESSRGQDECSLSRWPRPCPATHRSPPLTPSRPHQLSSGETEALGKALAPRWACKNSQTTRHLARALRVGEVGRRAWGAQRKAGPGSLLSRQHWPGKGSQPYSLGKPLPRALAEPTGR